MNVQRATVPLQGVSKILHLMWFVEQQSKPSINPNIMSHVHGNVLHVDRDANSGFYLYYHNKLKAPFVEEMQLKVL